MASDTAEDALRGKRVALVGKLASMPRREAATLLRRHGATMLDRPEASADLVILGEDQVPDSPESGSWLDDSLRQAMERGSLEILTESQLWQRLGMVEGEPIHPLYTPAMLADLLGVPVAVIRRWHRRGLIVPVREVRRLPYFDFQEVATARRLAALLAEGISPAAIEKQLAALARYLPSVERPLAQLSIIVQGKQILLRQGDGLIEPGGQLRFDFEAAPSASRDDQEPLDPAILSLAEAPTDAPPASPEAIARIAAELEEEGQLDAAVEMYRAALAAGGPKAELCFQLAELLYRLGDTSGARERYYMTIELDEDYVEARANLGCVLAETGQPTLAVAAFLGGAGLSPRLRRRPFPLSPDARRTRARRRSQDPLAHLPYPRPRQPLGRPGP